MTLAEILKDSYYKLTQFNLVEIDNLEKRIIKHADSKGGLVPYINCLVRNKEVKLTPEETIRQLYLQILMDHYGYHPSRMELEYPVSFGIEKKRADIVIFDKDNKRAPYILIELKKPKLKESEPILRTTRFFPTASTCSL